MHKSLRVLGNKQDGYNSLIIMARKSNERRHDVLLVQFQEQLFGVED